MPRSKAVWGIDVGHCALKALKLTSNAEGDVEVIGQDYIEHGKILSQPDADPPELIAKSLEKFLSRNDITEDGVVVSVPGQHTLARFSKLPPVDAKKIPDIVQFEANQQIPFDMDEVVWDYQTFSEEDSPEIEVGIFAMKRDLIHEHLAYFSDVGIEPVMVQAAPLALYDALKFDGQCSEETTVLVDIGAENTDLIITDQIRIWTRTIPIGGNNFTDALVNGFKLSFSKAENLKRQASGSKYARQIFQAMRPIFADLVGEVQRSIGFYTSTHREAKLDRLIGMGNAFKLPGLQKFLQQNLGITVVKPSEFKALKAAANYPRDYLEQILSFGVAYGLALEGLDHGSIKSNLLPPEIARQMVWRKKQPWFAAAAACLLVCAGLVWWRQSTDMGSLASNRGNADSVRKMDYAQAASLFQSGPRTNTPREFAVTVKEMAASIKSEYDQKKQQGKREADECRLVLDLQRTKALWPQILQAVHEALEPPQKLADAESAREYVQVILNNSEDLKRTQRKEVFIEALESQYVPSVYARDYREPDAIEIDPEPLFEYYTDQDIDGFLITLRCRTTHEGRGKFVEDTLISALRESGHSPDRDFYFDGVRLVASAQESSRSRVPIIIPPSARSGGRSRGGGFATPPGTEQPTSATRRLSDVDKLTFEDISEDWNFVIKFVVVLDLLPEEKTPGTPSGADSGGQRSGSGARGRRGGGR